MTESHDRYEAVYAWPVYWDGPREGVADFEGRPHRFVANWNSAEDDYADTFSLYPIDDATLRIVVEQWAIWRRWVAARLAGATSDDTHPALPEDRQRRTALEAEWTKRVAGLRALPRHATAEFRPVRDEFLDLRMAATLEVSWRLVEGWVGVAPPGLEPGLS
jgi:hypothetical protein